MILSACYADMDPSPPTGGTRTLVATRAPIELPPRNNGSVYDAYKGVWLTDSDRDGIPDVVELEKGTDPFNDSDRIVPNALAGICASSSFRFIPGGANGGVCIHTDEQPGTTYNAASDTCRTYHKTGRICSYEDLSFIYRFSSWDPTYNANNMWIGNIVGDDLALRGNVDINVDSFSGWPNFDHAVNRVQESHQYWCCHTPD